MGRLFYCLILAAVWVSAARSAIAQTPATTLIQDVVYRGNGTPAHGVLLISWPAFATADHKAVAAGSMSVTLGTGGTLSLALVPNHGGTPAGTYYKVLLKLDDGTTNTEFWSVPATSPTTISAVRTTLSPQGASQGQASGGAGVDGQPISPSSLNGIPLCDQYQGGLPPDKIDNCIASLGGNPGLAIIPATLGLGSPTAVPDNARLLDVRGTGGPDHVGNEGQPYLKDVLWRARWTQPAASAQNYEVMHLHGEEAAGGTNSDSLKTNYLGMIVTRRSLTPGQHSGIGIQQSCYSTGDCQALGIGLTEYGGHNAAGDEGLQGSSLALAQGAVAFTGTVSTVTDNGSTYTIGFSAGVNASTAGEQRLVIDTNGSKVYSTGTVTIDGSAPPMVTGSGTAWAAALGGAGARTDLCFSMTGDDNGALKLVVPIASVTDDTHLLLNYRAAGAARTWQGTTSGAYRIYYCALAANVTGAGIGATGSFQVSKGTTQWAQADTFEMPLGYNILISGETRSLTQRLTSWTPARFMGFVNFSPYNINTKGLELAGYFHRAIDVTGDCNGNCYGLNFGADVGAGVRFSQANRLDAHAPHNATVSWGWSNTAQSVDLGVDRTLGYAYLNNTGGHGTNNYFNVPDELRLGGFSAARVSINNAGVPLIGYNLSYTGGAFGAGPIIHTLDGPADGVVYGQGGMTFYVDGSQPAGTAVNAAWTMSDTGDLASGDNGFSYTKSSSTLAISGAVTTNGCRHSAGTGSPEGAITGSPCDSYVNKAGGSATTFYVKESGTGNTGWAASQPALGFTPENAANKGQASGYAALDATGKVPSGQVPALPESQITGLVADLGAKMATSAFTRLAVVGLWTNCTTGYLKYDGTCDTPSAGGAAWGSISGTLADQTDLGTALAGKVPTARTVNGHALSADVSVTKDDVGLGNADNTSDAGKPVSTATQTALDAKISIVGAVRQMCYLAGANNASAVLADADDQPEFWFNLTGRTQRVTGASCKADLDNSGANKPRIQITNGANNVLSDNSGAGCDCAAASLTSCTVNATYHDVTTSSAVGFTAVTAGGYAKRVTVCLQLTAQ